MKKRKTKNRGEKNEYMKKSERRKQKIVKNREKEKHGRR
jgi:hypothetical protein